MKAKAQGFWDSLIAPVKQQRINVKLVGSLMTKFASKGSDGGAPGSKSKLDIFGYLQRK